MRLGKYKIELNGTKIKEIYQGDIIHERHRHRFTVNQKYLKILNMNGFNVVGKCPDSDLIEIVELNEKRFDHPWFIGTQYHPEYQSSPFNPHPLFFVLNPGLKTFFQFFLNMPLPLSVISMI